MALHWTGNKQQFEQMAIEFTDTYNTVRPNNWVIDLLLVAVSHA